MQNHKTAAEALGWVTRGNLTPRSSQNRTWTSRLIRLPLSSHRSYTSNDIAFFTGSSHQLVDFWIRLNNPPPFAPDALPSFITTTGWSAPVFRIGTLILVGLPLEFLPYYRNDRFPRCTWKPESSSRRLHTGCHPACKSECNRLSCFWKKSRIQYIVCRFSALKLWIYWDYSMKMGL